MKTDLYTKSILTIIAICLTIIVLKEVSIIPKAYATSHKIPILMNKNYGLVPLNEDGSINIRLNYGDIIDVRLRGIDETSHLRWEAINVKVAN